jgi:oligoendopeptidase F
MELLYDVIQEKLQISHKTSQKEKKTIQNCIYKQLQKNNTTGKFYNDDHWLGVDAVRDDVEEGLYNAFRKTGQEYTFDIYPINGGYRTSKDGMSKWKEYEVVIYNKKNKEQILIGTLNCHAAGTIEDPFKMYDMSFVLCV